MIALAAVLRLAGSSFQFIHSSLVQGLVMSEKSFAIISVTAAIVCGTFFYPPPPPPRPATPPKAAAIPAAQKSVVAVRAPAQAKRPLEHEEEHVPVTGPSGRSASLGLAGP